MGHEGLIKRLICAHVGLAPKVGQLCVDNKIECFILPQGVCSHILRATAGRKPGLITHSCPCLLYTSGRKLSSNQGISFPISEMYAYVSALKNMLYHTAALSENGNSYTVEVSALKIIANEICRKICQKSQEIHGA